MGTRGGWRPRPSDREDSQDANLEYPLPKDVAAAWGQMRSRGGSLNAGLIFDRFLYDGSGGTKAKEANWKRIVEATSRIDTDLLTACLNRWEQTVAYAHGNRFTLRTDWRLVTGLGRGGPLEVGFAFNRYGFPILAGSGLKGLARAWGLRQVALAASTKELAELDGVLGTDGDLNKSWRTKFGDKPVPECAGQFRSVFGTTAAAGGAVFFDGMPTEPVRLQQDITNPHYPDYYSGRDAPTDSQNPKPVNFLTVAPGSEFVFAIGWRGRWDENASRLRELAEKWLRKGLIELGAGAKTSAGYGYFVSPEPEGKP